MSYREAKHETRRLLQVTGDSDKKNDVIFCGSLQQPANLNVVFFSGDVQDYKEKMLAHRDNRRHAAWDLESTAAIIHRRFEQSHVWVVKAAHMELGIFNVFSNFVRWKSVAEGSGGPMHETGQRSWQHLKKLLENAVNEMNKTNELCEFRSQLPEEHQCNRSADMPIFQANLPIVLVGFSKGCVVLNQLSYDLALASKEPEMETFIDQVKSIYWLDGGHAGGRDTWITREDILKDLTRFEVECHVTPYQVNDPSRPWIGREQRRFASSIAKFGGKVTNTLHFENDERSLENHFKILEVF